MNVTERIYPRITHDMSVDQRCELLHALSTHLGWNCDDDEHYPYERYATGTLDRRRRALWNDIRDSRDDMSDSVRRRIRDVLITDGEFFDCGTALLDAYQRFYARVVLRDDATVASLEELSDTEMSDEQYRAPMNANNNDDYTDSSSDESGYN